MKLKKTVILLLIGVVIQNIAEELNLNVFQQNDYKLKFERVELVRYNKEFFKDFSLVTFKYNRSTPVSNCTLIPKIDIDSSMTCVIQAYKFMSNEYRFFPIHFGVNCCKGFAADIGGVRSRMQNCGNIIGCPLHKGTTYHFCNWSPDGSKFPPYVPNGEYKIELQVLRASQELFVVDCYATIFRPIV